MTSMGLGTSGRHDHPLAARSPRRELVTAADTALRETLGAGIRAPHCDGEVAGPRLRVAVRALCDEAHERGARAEDVIVAVKLAWASLAELTARPSGDGRRGGDLLRHFITVCIDEFYADRSAMPRGEPA